MSRLLTAVILLNAGVAVMRAINPPWPVWQMVLLGAVIGLAVDVGLQRLRRVL